VPDDIQAKLLIPLLSSQAKVIVGRMTNTDLESYDQVKQFLLSEFRLTPRESINCVLILQLKAPVKHMCCFHHGYETYCRTTYAAERSMISINCVGYL